MNTLNQIKMQPIKSLQSITMYEFIDYCIQIKDNQKKLKDLNNLIFKSLIESEEYAVYYILFRQICWNGIPKYNIKIIDVFDMSDEIEVKLANRFTLDSNIFEKINLIEYVVKELAIKHDEILSNEDVKRKFFNYLLAYFYYTVVCDITEYNDEELLAMFICSISSSNIKAFYDEMKFINYEIINFIEYAFSEIFENYCDENNYIVVPQYNQIFGMETPYDYFSLSRNIIEQHI